MITRATIHPPIRSDGSRRAILKQVNTLAWLLDNSIHIPVINYRTGFDPLIGLIPGFGDIAGLIVAAYIVLQGVRLGAPQAILAQMMVNIMIDALVGIVPGIGDLFDLAFKASAMNVHLLNEASGYPHSGVVHEEFVDKRVFWALLVIFFLFIALIVLGGIALFWWLVHFITPH
jgi:hypothetical protein